MPGTARVYGLEVRAWVDARRDPERAAEVAARYLHDLHERFGHWHLAFAAYNAAYNNAVTTAAPNGAAPAAVASPPASFGGASLEWQGNDNDPSSKTVRLRDRLNEADTERRKDEEAAEKRERAAEIRREERMAKIKYMRDMPDSQPAGTGAFHIVALYYVQFSDRLI